jgi:hypothetical protein
MDKFAKKQQKGFRGYPVATVAFDGPDDTQASKVSLGSSPTRVRKLICCSAGSRTQRMLEPILKPSKKV